ncbi:aspartate aminotransferase family protein [Sporolactobacillus sp. THM7-4]|nr:aspartate aminotransferase family protein [Sporolactobacillus sp. THM7-4]
MLNTKSAEKVSPVMSAYGRFPITIVKGKGSYVWDKEGTKYLDYTSGIAVCALGHAPDAVAEVLKKQLDTLWHCSNLFHIESQEKLAEMLVNLSGCDQVFFCNSGAEANEGAIKLARRYARLIRKKSNGHIVTFSHSFHGRTMATLTATAQEKIQDGFAPLVPGFRYLPYNSSEAISSLEDDDDCIAVLLEMVQGEGGVIPADQEWIHQLDEICSKKGILLMVDEVQTGIGRTGTLFAYEQYGIDPDVVTVAKALGSGIPIGAVLAKKHVSQVFTPGTHGSTFGGNPFSTTAGVATLETFKKENVLARCTENGIYLAQKLSSLQEKYPDLIKDVRGKGLLVGVETSVKAIDLVNKLREKYQILILTAGEKVLRILPPLITDKDEIDHFISKLDAVLNN